MVRIPLGFIGIELKILNKARSQRALSSLLKWYLNALISSKIIMQS